MVATFGLLGLFSPEVGAGTDWSGYARAVEACRAAQGGASVEMVTAIDGGSGGTLVWLTDTEANLWLCSADAAGHVHTNSLIFDDLLRGAGAKLLPPVTVDRNGKPVLPGDPLRIAEGACQAYLGNPESLVLESGPDGLEGDWVPGYFVFLGTKAGETFLCNATPNAQVWVFARIGEAPFEAAPVG